MSQYDKEISETDIAIIGMAVRLPGAKDVNDYWQNLANGVESYTTYTDEELLEKGVSPETLSNPDYQKIGRPLEGMDLFDAPLFGFSPKDASIMDPQHRQFLEVSWEALEHAGYDPAQYKGQIGIFGGSGHNAYMPLNLMTNPEFMENLGMFLARHTSNDKDFLTTRVSYCLNMKGPSINVQTACSTSLVAIHLASQSLLSGECDMALAGGVTIEMPHGVGYMFQEGEILSSDGHCYAFDENSNGTVFGSGAAQVVIKRLQDAVDDGDTIHAVIKGSAINNDGSDKVGYLAPSVDGQAAAIVEALMVADVEADTISYVEAHGTGTAVGDPIEISALTQAYRTQTNKTNFCAVGSVKTNIGHLDTAAGAAGLIKIVESLKHQQLPASLNFTRPNPAIELEDSPFYVNAELKDWDSDNNLRRAAINSLGVGGTNAHIILEEAPKIVDVENDNKFTLFCLSARSPEALDQVTHRLEDFTRVNSKLNIGNAAYTLKVGRKAQTNRQILVCDSSGDLITALSSDETNRLHTYHCLNENPSIYFMFTGQGAQYENMCKDLYEKEAVFRDSVDLCNKILQSQLGEDIINYIYPQSLNESPSQSQLNQTNITQPALFTIEYSMAQLLLSWNVKPDGMIGHSIGEYVAACLSKIFSLEDALKLVSARGRLMQSMPQGSMLAVPLESSELACYLNEEISVAAINSQGLSVVSGSDAAIDLLSENLKTSDIETTRLHTSHAFHSAMMDPIIDEFKALFDDIHFGNPKIPFISNITGDWVDSDLVCNSDYWAKHLRGTVNFASGLERLMSTSNAAFVECGPGHTLSSFVRQNTALKPSHNIIQTIRHPKTKLNDQQMALTAFGKLWLAGVDIDWVAAHGESKRRRIPLPTYPFEHQRYWIEPGKAIETQQSSKDLKKQEYKDWFFQAGWNSYALTENISSEVLANTHILYFINDDTMSQILMLNHQKMVCKSIIVRKGDSFEKISNSEYVINPEIENDYEKLFQSQDKDKIEITHIVHLWTFDNEGNSDLNNIADVQSVYTLGYDSLFNIAKYFSTNSPDNDLQISVITNRLYQVSNEAQLNPLKATMLGPAKVMSQEISQLNCKCIDVNFSHMQDWNLTESYEQLATEVLLTTQEEEICYRGTTRFVKSFKPTSLESSIPSLTGLKNNSTYLITGGLGGIGAKLAKFLVDNFQSNLVVFNHTPMPDKDSWTEYLDTHSVTDKIAERITTIQSLEKSGVSVLSINVDVCNQKQVKIAIEQARSKFGKIEGIFHTAGIVDDNLIALKSLDESRKVLNPKVQGLLNIENALDQSPLDFILLFSSVSSAMGLSGQIDYTAANAFLDAYATSNNGLNNTRIVAVDWAIWANAGMAVRLSENDFANKHYFYTSKRKIPNSNSLTDEEYSANLSTNTHWLIDEHRNKQGVSLIPGTAYLEFARSAFDVVHKNQPIRMTDVIFISPFVIEADEKKDIHVQIIGSEAEKEFIINSDANTEHVRGRISYVQKEEPEKLDVDSLLSRCDDKIEIIDGQPQHSHLDFGSRWHCVKAIHYGKNEAIIELNIADQFADELKEYILHPAVMDMATGTAQALNPNYDPVKDLYVPISYSEITVFHPLSRKLYSHVIYNDAGDSASSFDVTITDEDGNILVIVQQFLMKRVDPSVLEKLKSPKIVKIVPPAKTPSELFFETGIKLGLNTEQGMQAIDDILSKTRLSQIIVSPIDFNNYLYQARCLRNEDKIDESLEDSSEFSGVSRPNISTKYVAPGNELETVIEKVWKSALGMSEIGVNDDFFELGGHSLLLTQVVSRLRKSSGLEIPLMNLFETPTIAQWATIIDSNQDGEDNVVPLLVSLNRNEYKVKYKEIVKYA